MRRTLAGFACVVLLVGSDSYAETVTATGTIETVNPTAKTIEVLRKTAKGEKSGTFTVSPTAEVLVAGKAADLGMLTKGQSVTVTYDTKAKQVTKIEAKVLEVPPANPEHTVAWFLSKAEAELAGILDANERSELIARIASVRAAHKEYDAAQKSLEQLSGRWKDVALMSIAVAMASDHVFDKALETVSQIAEPLWTVSALCSIAKEQDASGNKVSARQTFEVARLKANSWHLLTMVAERQFAVGDKAGASRSFEAAYLLSKTSLKGNTDIPEEQRVLAPLLSFIMHSRSYGDKEVRLDCLADAIRQAQDLPPTERKWAFLSGFAKEYVALGEITTAQKLALSIPVKAPDFKDAVYSAIVKEQLNLHDVSGARESFKLVKGSTIKSELLVAFAIAESRDGVLTKATTAALKMSDSYEKVTSLLAVARAHLEHGQSNLACDTLAAAEKVAKTLPENTRPVQIQQIVLVAAGIIKSGYSDQGHGMRLALQQPSSWRESLSILICQALVKAKRLAEAKELLLDGRLGTRSTYEARSIAKAEVASQDLPSLPEWIGRLSSRAERLSAYLGCADALIEKEMGNGK